MTQPTNVQQCTYPVQGKLPLFHELIVGLTAR